jgi:hypothetical protein
MKVKVDVARDVYINLVGKRLESDRLQDLEKEGRSLLRWI